MAVHLVPLVPALIQERQFEERSHVGPVTRERDEQRHVGRIVFDALAIRVEVDRPIVTPNGESIGRNVFPDSNSLRQGVACDLELVRTIYGISYRRRCRQRRRRFGRSPAHTHRADWKWSFQGFLLQKVRELGGFNL